MLKQVTLLSLTAAEFFITQRQWHIPLPVPQSLPPQQKTGASTIPATLTVTGKLKISLSSLPLIVIFLALPSFLIRF